MSFNRHENRLVRSESQANRDWAAPESRQQPVRNAPNAKPRMRAPQRPPFTVVDLYHVVRLPLAALLCVVAIAMWVL